MWAHIYGGGVSDISTYQILPTLASHYIANLPFLETTYKSVTCSFN